MMRELWRRVETVHAVTYFGDESRDAARAAGLRGFWMGYFGFRAAPLGRVDADQVTAAFHNFAPSMVRRSIPDAWNYADPDELVARRSAAAAATLARIDRGRLDDAISALPTLLEAAMAHDVERGALATANRAVVLPDDPVEQLWQACTLLREQRGDAHVHSLSETALPGCDAHLLLVAERQLPDDLLRDNRGWTDDEWTTRRAALVDRGLIGPDGMLTDTGRNLRLSIEDHTDRAAAACWLTTGPQAVEAVITALDPIVQSIARSGTIPFPNPMGLPKPT